MSKFHMSEWAVEKVSAVSMNYVQAGGKETRQKKKNLYTWVKALICKWSSYWKHIENAFSKQDAAWGLKPVQEASQLMVLWSSLST